MLPAHAYADYWGEPICRLLNGLWQLSGAHGDINPDRALRAMLEYQRAGQTTWDLADHYGPAEAYIGAMRRELQVARVVEDSKPSSGAFLAFTKWVPRPGRMSREVVETAIETSLRRMATKTLDMLQFHWWDYADKSYLQALRHLSNMQEEGKIRRLGLTNFDSVHLAEICDEGHEIVSNQVQFSIIDRRPEAHMIEVCEARGIHLLAYGAVCGGLLSEKYLRREEPSFREMNTASLRKYQQMIGTWGGWPLFQELLAVLEAVALKHQVTIPAVAMRYVLEKPQVAGVICGVRFSIAEHREANARVFDFALDADDYANVHAVTDRSRDLLKIIGDCGDEYRR